MSSGNEADAIYTDFSKAFVRIIPIRTWTDNSFYNVHSFHWTSLMCTSYLADQMQKDVINGQMSREIVLRSGAWQSSHLVQ